MLLLRSFKVFFCKATAPPEQLKDEVVVLVRRAIGVIMGQQADLVRRIPFFRTLKFSKAVLRCFLFCSQEVLSLFLKLNQKKKSEGRS